MRKDRIHPIWTIPMGLAGICIGLEQRYPAWADELSIVTAVMLFTALIGGFIVVYRSYDAPGKQ